MNICISLNALRRFRFRQRVVVYCDVLSELGRHRATIRDIREAKINERDDLSLIFVLIPM